LAGEVVADATTITALHGRKSHQLCDTELRKQKKLHNLEKTRKVHRTKMIPGGRPCNLQDNDAMLERGSKDNHHTGSKKLREIVRAWCKLYELASKAERGRIIQDVMRTLFDSRRQEFQLVRGHGKRQLRQARPYAARPSSRKEEDRQGQLKDHRKSPSNRGPQHASVSVASNVMKR
jgi:hypothetical protein